MLFPAHRRFLISELIKGIETIGPQFEEFGTRLVDYIANKPMLHRGLNPHGHAVGHAVDSVSTDGQLAAEYSAEHGYFDSPYRKIFKDLHHCRHLHQKATRILLLSSQSSGPKDHTSIVNLQARLNRLARIDVEVYDARRQAEFIVDQLLLNDAAVDNLSPYLATLDKVRNEYSATNLLPKQTAGYLPRTQFETDTIEALRTNRVVALAGMSGAGKSETTVAITAKIAGEFELVVWVAASAVAANNLGGIEVDRRGHRVNLLHLLRDRSCLAILDDLRIGLTAQDLKALCGSRSAILVTRQTAREGDVRIPLLCRDDARLLLEHDLPSKCPDDIFEVVWKTIGGHPQALRLMNAGVRTGSWDDLPGDCEAIGQYPDEDQLQKLADRLLGRLEALLEKELAFFIWCRSARVDRSFARRALGAVGLRKLDDTCLLAPDRSDVVRLHEIVSSVIPALNVPVDKYAVAFDADLDTQIEELVFGAGTALSFLNFCHVHGAKLEALLQVNPDRSTCLYCLANTWSEHEVKPSLIGDPIARAKAVKSSSAPRDIDVSAICEAVEALYRKEKLDSNLDGARAKLHHDLLAFSTLAEAPGISRLGRRTALHHKAKALRNLSSYEEAAKLCESILAEFDSPATKLLFARLLLFSSDKSDLERAKDLLFEILEAARVSPATAEISITLAAIETLGRWQLKQWFREALERYGDLVATFIIESAARGYDQAFVAFASVGRDLRYNDEARFVSVLEQLPKLSPEDARDDKERAAWGHILLSASESGVINRLDELATEAIQFYDALQKPDDFSLQQKGHALVLLGRHEEAVKVLQPLVGRDPNPWNRFWLSKALLARGDLTQALHLVTEAISDPKGKGYQAALFEHRWEIRKVAGDVFAVEDLAKAHECCKDGKHRAALAAKLATERELDSFKTKS